MGLFGDIFGDVVKEAGKFGQEAVRQVTGGGTPSKSSGGSKPCSNQAPRITIDRSTTNNNLHEHYHHHYGKK